MKLETFMVLTFVVAPVLFMIWLCWVVYGNVWLDEVRALFGWRK